ncbi:type II toxin-antitoxin system RelB family antitoxin [Xylocopilactobacillus apis]|uniref:CopG family transcriptional regulator n=1 Tax=Xylocopilactobacillus apis TaxID=2932183 RepID=A0AAU9CP13_9LACO|nr:DUF6290 family protein [Xylocopilactobacillus apis]BDR55702.1 hypothetical protein KIMC2_02640 [Xylocopilactobacillus apis]
MTQATSVRFDDRINDLLNVYTESHSISKSEFIQAAVQEKLEDWLDIEKADLAFKAWLDDDKRTLSWDDTLKELNLENE